MYLFYSLKMFVKFISRLKTTEWKWNDLFHALLYCLIGTYTSAIMRARTHTLISHNIRPALQVHGWSNAEHITCATCDWSGSLSFPPNNSQGEKKKKGMTLACNFSPGYKGKCMYNLCWLSPIALPKTLCATFTKRDLEKEKSKRTKWRTYRQSTNLQIQHTYLLFSFF